MNDHDHPAFIALTGDPERGDEWFFSIVAAAGEGTHTLEVTVKVNDERTLSHRMLILAEGPVREIDEKAAPTITGLLAVLAGGKQNGVITLRTDTSTGTVRVSGWQAIEGLLIGLSENGLGLITEGESGLEFVGAPEPHHGADITDEELKRGAKVLDALLDAAGDGTHALTIATRAKGFFTKKTMRLEVRGEAVYVLDSEESAGMAEQLALIASDRNTGSIMYRTQIDPTTDRVRMWSVAHGDAFPLTRAEAFAAFCTDERGEPTPPESGVVYADAPSLWLD